jgi:rhodanese-related sulfurtransferase
MRFRLTAPKDADSLYLISVAFLLAILPALSVIPNAELAPTISTSITLGLERGTTQMGEGLNELPKDKMIVPYCWDTWCSLATTAAVVLADHGYRVKELFGGVAAMANSQESEDNGFAERIARSGV